MESHDFAWAAGFFDGEGWANRAGRGVQARINQAGLDLIKSFEGIPDGDPSTANLDPYVDPVGIYTIPEISFVGSTEEELTEEAVPYEVGVSRYRELARGMILGDSYGMLKLLASPEDHRLLGVHVFGTGATEVIHVGQAVMGNGGTIDYLVGCVFNYPTLAESYKVAALDAMNKMQAVDRLIG